jgi:hypothetical protein
MTPTIDPIVDTGSMMVNKKRRPPGRPSTRVSGRQGAARRALREAIYDRILRAVLEHRLPPGTKLVEDRLAELFDTSRAQVRDVLARLANEGIVRPSPTAARSSPRPRSSRPARCSRRAA